MKRRDFLKSTAVFSGGIFAGLHKAVAQSFAPIPGPQPNILFILVDELRYPTVFPGDIKTAGEFLANFMPNVYNRIWQLGVKFGNHNTAANACTPSRGVLITGLYSQQNWLITTILSTPYPSPPTLPQPVLNPAYPTFGKLLQAAGYQTPYVVPEPAAQMRLRAVAADHGIADLCRHDPLDDTTARRLLNLFKLPLSFATSERDNAAERPFACTKK